MQSSEGTALEDTDRCTGAVYRSGRLLGRHAIRPLRKIVDRPGPPPPSYVKMKREPREGMNHGGGHSPGHSYYVIDRAGVVRLVADDPMMGDWTSAIEEFVKSL